MAMAWDFEFYTIKIPRGKQNMDLKSNENLAQFQIKDGRLEKYVGTATEVVIPEDVISIESYAFEGCSTLKSISIPESVTNIGQDAFLDCDSLVEIEVAAGNRHFYVVENCLIDLESGEAIVEIDERKYWAAKEAEEKHKAELEAIEKRVEERLRAEYEKRFAEEKKAKESAHHGLQGIKILPESALSIEDHTLWGLYNRETVEKTRKKYGIVVPVGVTKIGSNAFERCSLLATIMISDGVTKIGDGAFNGCSSLESVTIPSSVTEIGYGAFRNCGSLKNITISDSVTEIGGYVFCGCTSLKSIKIPAGVTELRESAFCACRSLQSVTIPDSVTMIGRSAFFGCTSLTSFAIPKAAKSIGEGAFKRCGSLTNIVIPKGVTKIEDATFADCYSLKDIIIPEDVQSIGQEAFKNCSSLRSITIPRDVTSIKKDVLYGCRSLTSIAIPERVTDIEDGAFAHCSALEKIEVSERNTYYHVAGNCLIQTKDKRLIAGCKSGVIPDDGTVWSIGRGAFAGFNLLENITIPEGVRVISEQAFENCNSLKSIIIPKSLIRIRDMAFKNCTSLTNVAIPEGVEGIESGAFFGCRSLRSISIPQSVTEIKHEAFKGCSSLKKIVIPAGVTAIGESVFSGCSSMVDVEIPEGVTDIWWNAFNRCRSLTNITIPKSLIRISEGAFYGCSSIEKIEVAPGNPVYHSAGNCLIKTISRALIIGCKASVIPNDGSVRSIEPWAFAGCGSLTGITIPKSVTEIKKEAFLDCKVPEKIEVAEGNMYYHVAGNCLIETRSKTLILGGKVSAISDDGSVTKIESGAFAGCCSLKSIPKDVVSISRGAFGPLEKIEVAPDNPIYHSAGNCLIETESKTLLAGCRTSIIPSDGSVTSIGSYAFAGCDWLTDITLPKGVTEIGFGAFSDCTSLTSIVIPESVKSIDKCAFYKCSSLRSIMLPESLTTIGDNAFTDCHSLERIQVAEGNQRYCVVEDRLIDITNGKVIAELGAEVCKANEVERQKMLGEEAVERRRKAAEEARRRFKEIRRLPESELDIVSLTLKGLKNKKEIEASGVKYSIVIPVGVLWIGEWAFSGCSSLASIIIPEGVGSIGSRAFSNCSSLTNIVIPKGLKTIGKEAFMGCHSLISITIPASVTEIGEDAFEGCQSLNAVHIADLAAWCKIHFGTAEFCVRCTSNPLFRAYHLYVNGQEVTELHIPEGVRSIESYAFEGFQALRSVTIPRSVTKIESNAFKGCSALTSVTIPESVRLIGSNAFSGCKSLQNISIPRGVTEIEWGTFYDCFSLESITIPEGVTSIGRYAFSGCPLKSITIPRNVNLIGDYAFSGQYPMIEVATGNRYYHVAGNRLIETASGKAIAYIDEKKRREAEEAAEKQRREAEKQRQAAIEAKAQRRAAAELWLQNAGVETILSDNALNIEGGVLKGIRDRNAVENSFMGYGVIIPEGITSIFDSAFSECHGLKGIVIPEGVTNIGQQAFWGCDSLIKIEVAESNQYFHVAESRLIKTMGGEVIAKINEEKRKDAEKAVAQQRQAAAEAEAKHKAAIEQRLKDEGVEPLSESLLNIENGVLKGLKDKNAVETLGKKYSIIIPKGVTKIIEAGLCSSGAFQDCNLLASITIPESVVEIVGNAFRNCHSLEKIEVEPGNPVFHSTGNCLINTESKMLIAGCKESVIPTDGSVTSIGEGAFFGCDSLTNITIPEGMAKIEDQAFSGCSSLVSITIPKSVVKIGPSVFRCCSSLEKIEVASDNPVYHSAGNCLIKTDKKILVAGCEKSAIPNDGSVTWIGTWAFSGRNSLMSITIPQGVTTICSYAFFGCSSLTNIILPKGLKYVGNEAFSGCNSLTSIVIPEGVTSVDSMAFKGCCSLASIAIPQSIIDIKENAFDGCDSLIKIEVASGNSRYRVDGDYLIDTTAESSLIWTIATINAEKRKAAEEAEVARRLKKEGLDMMLPESTFNIEGTALKGLKDKKSVEDSGKKYGMVIPHGVSSIGNCAFRGCKGLIKVTIPERVILIEQSAFEDCTSLVKVTMPKRFKGFLNYGLKKIFGNRWKEIHFTFTE